MVSFFISLLLAFSTSGAQQDFAGLRLTKTPTVKVQGGTGGWDIKNRGEGGTGGWDIKNRGEGGTGGWDIKNRGEGGTGGWDIKNRN